MDVANLSGALSKRHHWPHVPSTEALTNLLELLPGIIVLREEGQRTHVASCAAAMAEHLRNDPPIAINL